MISPWLAKPDGCAAPACHHHRVHVAGNQDGPVAANPVWRPGWPRSSSRTATPESPGWQLMLTPNGDPDRFTIPPECALLPARA
jgi:hypothetical protein